MTGEPTSQSPGTTDRAYPTTDRAAGVAGDQYLSGAERIRGAEGSAAVPAPHVLSRLVSQAPDDGHAPHDLSQDELLRQASQIAEHLRGQLTELNRREQALNEQLAVLDRERREIRLSVQQLEDDLDARQQRLHSHEVELNQKIATCEGLIHELEESRAVIEADRNRLQEDQERFQQRVDTELAGERQRLVEETTALQEERERLENERESLRVQHEQAVQESEKRLSDEREAMREQAAAALAADSEQLQRERDAFADEMREQREKLAEEREEIELRRQQQHAQLQQELAAKRSNVEEELEQLRRQFEQQQHLVENRLRFQQEHLESLRSELAESQHDFQVEQQRSRLELFDRETICNLRSQQVNHARELLEEAAASCERERQVLKIARTNLQNERRQAVENLEQSQRLWDEERSAQAAELQRQQHLLTLHADNLEARRERLNKLRTELEETHQATLEMRIAVEESFAELMQNTGEETARQRVESARGLLAEHYRQQREFINTQRQELEAARTQSDRRLEKLDVERKRQAEWIAEREAHLQKQLDELRQQMRAVDQQQSALSEAEANQTEERLEAERVIRDLLKQISDLSEALAAA